MFALDDLVVCLDETPLGCFVELEGSPDRIDRAAARKRVKCHFSAERMTDGYLRVYEDALRRPHP